MVPASFWMADDATRGLSPLAACLYLRADCESLIGVMSYSPRRLAAAHRGTTEADVLAAIDELTGRGLARWWPDIETLAIRGIASRARGRAVTAAMREIAALAAEVRGYVLGYLRTDEGTDGGWHPLLKQEHEQEHEQKQSASPTVASLPLILVAEAPAKPSRRKAHAQDVDRVLDAIDAARVSLGEKPLAPYKRDRKTIAARLGDEGVTLDLLLAVVEARRRQCESDPRQIDWFDATSPFTRGPEGKGGWRHSLDLIEKSSRPVQPRATWGVHPPDAGELVQGRKPGEPYKSAQDAEEWTRIYDGKRRRRSAR